MGNLQSLLISNFTSVKGKVKVILYRSGLVQRVGRDIALHFHDSGTRKGSVVSSTPLPLFTHGKDPVPVVKEAGCTPGPVWTGGKSRRQRDSIPDRSARSQSLYRLSYRAHNFTSVNNRKYYICSPVSCTLLETSVDLILLLHNPSV